MKGGTDITASKIISYCRKIPDEFRSSKWITADNMYISAFIVFFLYKMLDTTLTPYLAQIHWKSPAVQIIVIVILSLKMLLYDMRDKKFPAMLLITYIVTVVSMWLLSYMELIPVCIYIMFVIAARGVDFRKLCVTVFAASAFVISWVTIRSQFGKITDLVYASRHSFGFIYPTDYAAHWLFAFLALFYYRKGILKWYEEIFMVISSASLLYFCRTRTSTLIILAIVVLSMLFRRKQPKALPERSKQLFFTFPVFMASLSFLLTTVLGAHHFINHTKIRESIDMRFLIGLKMIYWHGFSLMGRSLPDQGYGGSDKFEGLYTFIDNSYIRIAMHYGLVIFVMVMIYLTYIMLKSIKENDYAMLAVMIVLLIDCTMEHHLIDFSYNIFFFAGFAKLTDTFGSSDTDKH